MEPLTIFQAIKNSIDIIRSISEIRERRLDVYERIYGLIDQNVENYKKIVDDYFFMLSKLETGLRKKTPRDDQFQAVDDYLSNRLTLLTLRRQMYVETAELLKADLDPQVSDFFIAASRILDVSDSHLAIPGRPNSVSRFVLTEDIFHTNFNEKRRKQILERIEMARDMLEQRWQELIAALSRLKSAGHDIDWSGLASHAKWSKRQAKT